MAGVKNMPANAAAPRAYEGHSPEVGLGMLLRDTNIAFNRVLRAGLGRHEVTFGQFQHLRHLWEADGISQVELSRRIGIAKAESTGVIESLERLALIRRERDAADARRLLVFLTPKGRALQPPLWACAKEVNRLARMGLSPSDAAKLFQLLAHVRRNLA